MQNEEFINKVINDNCLNVFPLLQENSIHLIITSPPYNVGIPYDNYNDNRDWDEYLDWCDRWIKAMARVLRPDGRFVLNVPLSINIKNENITQRQPVVDFSILLRKNNLNIHSITLWTDSTRVKYTSWGSWKSASCPYIYSPYETLIIGYKDKWEKQEKGVNTISKKDFIYGVKGIYNFGTAFNEKCPVVFPDKLPSLFIELLSYENDVVLDPFCGSGTTVYNAKRLKRRFIGIEISTKYCKVAINRLLQDYFV